MRVFASLLVAVTCLGWTLDEGMYLVRDIPYKVINKKYKAGLTPAKVDRLEAAVGKVKMGAGHGSGTFVSATGLVFTNWHIVRDCVQNLRAAGKIPVKGKFDAPDAASELRCPGYSFVQTLDIEDISADVHAAKNPGAKAKEIEDACNNARRPKGVGYKCRVKRGTTLGAFSLPGNAVYLLEKLVDWKDVRLVYSPPTVAGKLGGAPFNFQYPRHALDFGFLRVYNDQVNKPDVPLDTQDRYLAPETTKAVSDQDFVMLMGYPGTTSRMLSAAGLKYTQTVELPLLISLMQAKHDAVAARARALRGKTDAKSVEEREKLIGERFSLMNSMQAFDGSLQGLNRNPKLLKQREAQDVEIAKNDAAAVTADADTYQELGKIFADFVWGVQFFQPSLQSWAVEHHLAGALVHTQVNLKSAFAKLATSVGLQAPYTYKEALAAVKGTKVGTIRQNLVVKLQSLQQKIRAVTMAAPRKIGAYEKARRAWLKGKPDFLAYFDANSTARFTYGQVKGVTKGKNPAPFGTRFSDFDLKSSVKLNGVPVRDAMAKVSKEHSDFANKMALDPAWKNTLVNFISDLDITRGNSGSGVVNAQLKVVGTAFDSNWEGIFGNYSYQADKEISRTVSVSMPGALQFMAGQDLGKHRIGAELLDAEKNWK